MPAKKTAKPKPSASERMKADGKSLIWATFDQKEKQEIRTAAAMSALPMSQFLKQHGLAAARKILGNLSK